MGKKIRECIVGRAIIGGLLGGVCICVSSLQANTVSWIGAGDTELWTNAANWNPGLPTVGDTIQIGLTAANEAQTIDLNSGTQTINQILGSGNIGSRSLTIENGSLVLQRISGGANPLVWFGTADTPALQTITIDSDILLDAATSTEAAILYIGGTNANAVGNADQTITLAGTIAGSKGTGYGARSLYKSGSGVLLITGDNQLDTMQLARGEVIAANAHALGNGQLTAANSVLSLRGTNVNLAGNLITTGALTLRLNEAGSSDRTFTISKLGQSSSSAGKVTIGPNAGGSTGNFILNLTASTNALYFGNQHNTELITAAESIVRFSQVGNIMYAPNGIAGSNAGISGGGNVEITGGGNTTFAVNMTYTGSTTISNGTLLISTSSIPYSTPWQATGSLSSSLIYVGTNGTFAIGGIKSGSYVINGIAESSYTLTSSQTLAGTGHINTINPNDNSVKTLNLQGTLAPGAPSGATTGVLTVTGNLLLDSTSVSNFELKGLTSGLYDKLSVSVTLTLGGTLNLLTDYAAKEGDTIDLFDWTTLNGTFANINGTNIGGGLEWDLSRLYIDGSISAVATVPEPSVLGLVAAGLAGLWSCGRHRGRKRLGTMVFLQS